MPCDGLFAVFYLIYYQLLAASFRLLSFIVYLSIPRAGHFHSMKVFFSVIMFIWYFSVLFLLLLLLFFQLSLRFYALSCYFRDIQVEATIRPSQYINLYYKLVFVFFRLVWSVCFSSNHSNFACHYCLKIFCYRNRVDLW